MLKRRATERQSGTDWRKAGRVRDGDKKEAHEEERANKRRGKEAK